MRQRHTQSPDRQISVEQGFEPACRKRALQFRLATKAKVPGGSTLRAYIRCSQLSMRKLMRPISSDRRAMIV